MIHFREVVSRPDGGVYFDLCEVENLSSEAVSRRNFFYGFPRMVY